MPFMVVTVTKTPLLRAISSSQNLSGSKPGNTRLKRHPIKSDVFFIRMIYFFKHGHLLLFRFDHLLFAIIGLGIKVESATANP